MKAINGKNNHPSNIIVRLTRVLMVMVFLLWATSGLAQMPPPDKGGPTNTPLASWSFGDSTNWTSDLGYAPVSFTNLNFSRLGNGASLVVDTNIPAWLQYNVYESDGTTNLTVDVGSVTFWFAADWSSINDTNGGLGPQEYGRLLEVGGYTPDSSCGWWSIYVDDGGTNIYFSAQTNDGSGYTYTISAPIDWTTNYFHFVALTYSSTNVSLYLDGQLATNDPGGLSVWPGNDVLSNGFYIGSGSNGVLQAHGLFNTVATYNYPLDSNDVQRIFNWDTPSISISPLNIPYMNALNSAPSSPSTNGPDADVITGTGYLQLVSSGTGITSSNVWITNVVATATGSGTNKMVLTFTIQGGTDNSPMMFLPIQCCRLAPMAFLGPGWDRGITVTPIAHESAEHGLFPDFGYATRLGRRRFNRRLRKIGFSKTDPNNYSTDGTGMSDGWEILYFGHIGIDPNARPGWRRPE